LSEEEECRRAVPLTLAAVHLKTIASMKHPLLDEHVDETRRRRVRQGPDGIFFDAAARLEGARQADCAAGRTGPCQCRFPCELRSWTASSPSLCRPLLTEFSTFTARVLASESWQRRLAPSPDAQHSAACISLSRPAPLILGRRSLCFLAFSSFVFVDMTRSRLRLLREKCQLSQPALH
jgi:hypothetical protein